MREGWRGRERRGEERKETAASFFCRGGAATDTVSSPCRRICSELAPSAVWSFFSARLLPAFSFLPRSAGKGPGPVARRVADDDDSGRSGGGGSGHGDGG